MSRLTAGTPHPIRKYAASYTAEQHAALEALKVPDLFPGMAREEFVNAALAPDGTVIPDAEGQLIAAAKERAAEILSGDLSDPSVLEDATRAARLVQEVVDHVAERRFLFVVDVHMTPVVYFQCAVAHNPDLPSS
jgi:hypothetical protein